MNRLPSVLVLAALAGACNRGPTDPALVANPAPLTDCSDDAFIAILGGGQAVVCRGLDNDPQVRACLEAPFTQKKPFAHVAELPGGPRLITVSTPERQVFQVRRFAGTRERVELFGCQPAPGMPDEELPYFCPFPDEAVAPIHRDTACGVLERARTLRRQRAGVK